jgi:hypothetical protein
MSDNFTFNHVDHVFGDIGGKIRSALQMADCQEEMNERPQLLGVFRDAILYYISISLLISSNSSSAAQTDLAIFASILMRAAQGPCSSLLLLSAC